MVLGPPSSPAKADMMLEGVVRTRCEHVRLRGELNAGNEGGTRCRVGEQVGQIAG